MWALALTTKSAAWARCTQCVHDVAVRPDLELAGALRRGVLSVGQGVHSLLHRHRNARLISLSSFARNIAAVADCNCWGDELLCLALSSEQPWTNDNQSLVII